MTAPKTILVIGELLWDLLPDGKKLGGAPANFANRLNELGHRVILVSSVGDDELGVAARKQLDGRGLHTDFIQTDHQHPTGTVDVFFDDDKNPDYHINTHVAFDYMRNSSTLLSIAQRADCIAFGSLAQRSIISCTTINSLIDNAPQAVKFFDINLRKECYTISVLTASLSQSDIVKLNHNELIEMGLLFSLGKSDYVSLAQQLVEKFNLKICLITFEAEGALAINNNGEVYYSPGYRVPMNDPLGAGDAFSAAFVNHYLSGRSIQFALDAGNKYGAIIVRQKGAMQSISESDVMDFDKMNYAKVVNKQYLQFYEDTKISPS